MPPNLRVPDYSFVAQGAQQLGKAVGAGVDYGIQQMKTSRYTGALQQMADFATGEGDAPELDQVRLYDKALKANAQTASQTAESYKGMMTNAAEQLADVDTKYADRMRGKMLFRQYVSPPTADDLKNEESRTAYTRRMTEQTANWLKKLQEIQGKAQGAKIAEYGRDVMRGTPITEGTERQVSPIGETGGFTEQDIAERPAPATTREAAFTGIQQRAQAAGEETPTLQQMQQYAPGAASLPTGTEQRRVAQGERRLDLTEQSLDDTREYRNAMLGLRQVEALQKAKKSKYGDRSLDADRILTFAERAHDDAQKVKVAAQEAIDVLTADQGEIVNGELGRGLPPTDKRVLRKKAELAAAEKTLKELSKGIQDLYTDRYAAEKTILGAQEAGQRVAEDVTEGQVRTLSDWMQQASGGIPSTRGAAEADRGGRVYGQTTAARQGTAAETELRQQALARLRELNQSRTSLGKPPLPLTDKNIAYLMNVIRQRQGTGQ